MGLCSERKDVKASKSSCSMLICSMHRWSESCQCVLLSLSLGVMKYYQDDCGRCVFHPGPASLMYVFVFLGG